MSSNNGFKIIIVGGGIAGLALANMLEQFDINYVLLEAHKDIIPITGASLGLAPNGLLILDQLGLYDALREVASGGEIDNVRFFSKTGKPLMWDKNMVGHFERRFGYPLLFMNRIHLLEALYENSHHKDRILTEKRVVNIEHGNDGVKVATKDGQVYSGDIVVGADGIHSFVRAEMARIANGIHPGTFDMKEEDAIPCYYQCSFGIAQDVPQWADHTSCFTMGDRQSFLIASGPGKRVYWFLTIKMPETKYGKDIPRYTKEDDELFGKKYAHLQIQKGLNFGHLYSKRLTSSLTSLHEVVMKKWFYKRIVLMGDSVHKPNPIIGQGGNGALETAAEFVNALLELRDSRPEGLKGVSSEEIDVVGQKMQNARHSRAKFINKGAHIQQALLAYENPIVSSLFLRVTLPIAGPGLLIESSIRRVVSSSRIKRLSVPFRPHQTPYELDLPAKPLRSAVATIPKWLLILLMGYVLYITTKAWRLPLDDLGNWGQFDPLDRTWLGNTTANALLRQIVSSFGYQILSTDPTARLQVIYFLSQLVSPLLIYTIEGYRSGHEGTLIAIPSLYLFSMQLQGIGRIAPLYTILSALFTWQRNAGRWLRPEVAKALIPALTLGYVVPSIMMFTPTTNTKSWQDWTALWQFSPVFFTGFTFIFSSVLVWWKRISTGLKESPFEMYEDADVPILKSVYHYAFALQTTAHLAMIAYAYFHPAITFADLFWNLPNPFESDWSLPTVGSQITVFLKYDLAMTTIAITAHILYSIWALRQMGYIESSQAVAVALASVLGHLLVGPGATWAGVWSWRESVFANLSTINRPPSASETEPSQVTNRKVPTGKLAVGWKPSAHPSI